jgi:hypothetical protein
LQANCNDDYDDDQHLEFSPSKPWPAAIEYHRHTHATTVPAPNNFDDAALAYFAASLVRTSAYVRPLCARTYVLVTIRSVRVYLCPHSWLFNSIHQLIRPDQQNWLTARARPAGRQARSPCIQVRSSPSLSDPCLHVKPATVSSFTVSLFHAELLVCGGEASPELPVRATTVTLFLLCRINVVSTTTRELASEAGSRFLDGEIFLSAVVNVFTGFISHVPYI